MDAQQKEALLEEFREYLENDFEVEHDEAPEDLVTLFSELSGLKNEVRIESRQIKGALDQFREAFTSLDSANQEVADMVRKAKDQEKERTQAILNPAIDGMIDLYERIAAGLQQSLPRLSFLGRLLPGWGRCRAGLAAHRQAQEMLLGRVLDLLRHYGVVPMATNGERFDPRSMKAVGFESDPGQADGIVLRENRKGFVREGAALRVAEVIVNKHKG
ncbi:MAG: nucleotide exchange factor GrpE [Planctomycetes bacterium]|nr:nucleotide exchange factor GrpE [Planctomycetota bacterium]